MNSSTHMNLKDILLEIELQEPDNSPFIYSVEVPVNLHTSKQYTWYEPRTIEELTKDKIEFRGRKDVIARMTDWLTSNKDSVWDKRPLPREIYFGSLKSKIDVVGVWTPYQGVQGKWKIYYIIYPPHPLSKEKLDRKSSEGINLKWDILENDLLPSSLKFLNNLKNKDEVNEIEMLDDREEDSSYIYLHYTTYGDLLNKKLPYKTRTLRTRYLPHIALEKFIKDFKPGSLFSKLNQQIPGASPSLKYNFYFFNNEAVIRGDEPEDEEDIKKMLKTPVMFIASENSTLGSNSSNWNSPGYEFVKDKYNTLFRAVADYEFFISKRFKEYRGKS